MLSYESIWNAIVSQSDIQDTEIMKYIDHLQNIADKTIHKKINELKTRKSADIESALKKMESEGITHKVFDLFLYGTSLKDAEYWFYAFKVQKDFALEILRIINIEFEYAQNLLPHQLSLQKAQKILTKILSENADSAKDQINSLSANNKNRTNNDLINHLLEILSLKKMLIAVPIAAVIVGGFSVLMKVISFDSIKEAEKYFISGGKDSDKQMHGVLTFTSGNVTLNNLNAGAGSTVKKTDEIKTGNRSIAIIQFGQTALLTLKSGTRVKLENLTSEKNYEKIELSQLEGSTFSKIFKKGTDYKIRSLTALAAVKGTSFDFTVSRNKTKITLLSGTVNVAQVNNGKEITNKAITLDAGQSVDVSDKKIEVFEKFSTEEKEKLNLFDKIDLVPAVDKNMIINPKIIIELNDLNKTGNMDSSVITKNIAEKITAIDEIGQLETKPKTLAELSKKYGKLSRVKLTDGKEYIGVYIQKPGKIEIITLDGTVTHGLNEIETISKYKH